MFLIEIQINLKKVKYFCITLDKRKQLSELGCPNINIHRTSKTKYKRPKGLITKYT